MADNRSAHLVFGGARSGKTAYALELARQSGLHKFMIATTIVEDDEMARRVARHRAEREADWRVIEEGLELAPVLAATARPDRILVVDCLTLWLSNVSFAARDMGREAEALADTLGQLNGPTILVSNELGQGLAPETALGRAFRDAHGLMNQVLARVCADVTLVAAGLPLILKSRQS